MANTNKSTAAPWRGAQQEQLHLGQKVQAEVMRSHGAAAAPTRRDYGHAGKVLNASYEQQKLPQRLGSKRLNPHEKPRQASGRVQLLVLGVKMIAFLV